MDYIYETHMHTSEASRCAKKPAAEGVAHMISKGYKGVIVTDHFHNGSTCVDRNLPWNEWVDGYCKGYENAKKAAEDTDLSVFFGVEFNFQGDEYLLYGIDKEWLLSHPQMLEYSRKELFEEVDKAGGLMIHAHPYRERYYIFEIFLSPENCHGVEIYNAQNPSYQNALAYRYAKKYKLPMSSGSDIHFKTEEVLGGVRCSRPLKDIHDFVQAFKNGELTPVSIRSDGTVVDVESLVEECEVSKEAKCPIIYAE